MYLGGRGGFAARPPSFGEVGKEVLLIFDRIITFSSIKICWLAYHPLFYQATSHGQVFEVPTVFWSPPLTE